MWPLPFLRKYPFWFEYIENGGKENGPQIVVITGFRDAATERARWRRDLGQHASHVYMTSLPQHGKQIDQWYPRGYISMTMMNAYCKALAREIDKKLGNRARHNNMPIMLCGHSMGVTTILWTLCYMPKDLLKHISIVGIAPAFHVDHNVPGWVRFAANFLRFYPGRITDTFDCNKVTDAVSVHKAIDASEFVYKGDPYVPFLYVASRLGHSAWSYVRRSKVPMFFIHGAQDVISPMPNYDLVYSACVRYEVFPVATRSNSTKKIEM